MTKYTNEELLQQLKNFKEITGKNPSYRSYEKFPELIRAGSTFAKAFGSFNDALKLAGLDTFYDENGKIRKTSTILAYCENCNVTLTKVTQKRFCSRKCHGQTNIRETKTYTCLTCGLDFLKKANKKHKIKYCSIKCQSAHSLTKSIDNFNNGKTITNKSIKKCLTELRGYKCEICSNHEWQNKPLTLEVDHIDGDPDNNFPNNVRLLCPNCHSQTPTFRVANQGNLKSDRRSLSRRKRYHGNT